MSGKRKYKYCSIVFSLLLFLSTAASVVFGQVNKPDSTIKTFQTEDISDDQKLTFEARRALKKGDTYLSRGIEKYNLALKKYVKALKQNPDNAYINFRVGQAYLLTKSSKAKAIHFLEKAYHQKHRIDEQIHFYLGMAYQVNFDPAKAITEYEKYIEIYKRKHRDLPADKKQAHINEVNKKIEECRSAIILSKTPVKVTIENIGHHINTSFPEYDPFISSDESVLYFTGRREDTKGGKKAEIDAVFYEDLYFTEKINDKWGEARKMENGFNKRSNDAIIGLSHDGSKMLVYRDTKEGDIYLSEKKDGEWIRPKKIKGVNSPFHESSACFSLDENKLYFISNRPGGYGGSDIYLSEKDEKGKWSDPVNIGKPVNSPYDEQRVYLSLDGKTLYFCSKGHNTMGGYDIFKTSINPDRSWSMPENMGYPINSTDDDISFVLSSDGKRGYYASIKPTGLGDKDIYLVHFGFSLKDGILDTEDELLSALAPPLPVGTTSPETSTDLTIVEKVEMKGDSLLAEPVVEVTDTSSTPGSAIDKEMSMSSEILYEKNSEIGDSHGTATPSLIDTLGKPFIDIDKSLSMSKEVAHQNDLLENRDNQTVTISDTASSVKTELEKHLSMSKEVAHEPNDTVNNSTLDKPANASLDASPASQVEIDRSLTMSKEVTHQNIVPEQDSEDQKTRVALSDTMPSAKTELEKSLSMAKEVTNELSEAVGNLISDQSKNDFSDSTNSAHAELEQSLTMREEELVKNNLMKAGLEIEDKNLSSNSENKVLEANAASTEDRGVKSESTLVNKETETNNINKRYSEYQEQGESILLNPEENSEAKITTSDTSAATNENFENIMNLSKEVIHQREMEMKEAAHQENFGEEDSLLRKEDNFGQDQKSIREKEEEEEKLVAESEKGKNPATEYTLKLASEIEDSIISHTDSSVVANLSLTNQLIQETVTAIKEDNSSYQDISSSQHGTNSKQKASTEETVVASDQEMLIKQLENQITEKQQEMQELRMQYMQHKQRGETEEVTAAETKYAKARRELELHIENYRKAVDGYSNIPGITEDRFSQRDHAGDYYMGQEDADNREGPQFIYFDFNKADLRPESFEELKKWRELINKYKDPVVEISGHADHIGEDEYNESLSMRRAKICAEQLYKYGIIKENIIINAYGESRPFAPNTNPDGTDNPAGRQKNRRVELIILNTGKAIN